MTSKNCPSRKAKRNSSYAGYRATKKKKTCQTDVPRNDAERDECKAAIKEEPKTQGKECG